MVITTDIITDMVTKTSPLEEFGNYLKHSPALEMLLTKREKQPK